MCVAHDQGIRLRDMTVAVGITERAAHRILSELVEDGYVLRERQGRRNRYEVVAELPLRHPLVQGREVGDLLEHDHFEALKTHIPAPEYEEDHPLQALVTNLDASPYLGRLALCRVRNGTIKRGQAVAWCRADGTIEAAKIGELYVAEELDRVDVDEAGPGEIIAVAGLAEVTIGETLADPDDPRPLPLTHVDEPSLSMTIGINTAPTSGKDGDKLTARLVKGRLDQEVVGNVSIRVLPGDRPDRWEVQGRGELQLAVLVEMMRREGFELTVGKPQVVTRTIDGKLHEPVERVAIDAPEEYLGVISQLLALRKGRMENMVNHGTGWIRMEHLVPARGLIGFRTEFLTETRGTGQLHHVFEGYEPWHGDLRTRPTGSLVADRIGVTTGFALQTLQERGSMFVGPTEEVYEGMIVGENSRSEDMDVNPTKEKKLTNMRQSSSEEFTRLIPKRELSLEQALEFIREDECVEVTPAPRPSPQGAPARRRSACAPAAEAAPARTHERKSGPRRGRSSAFDVVLLTSVVVLLGRRRVRLADVVAAVQHFLLGDGTVLAGLVLQDLLVLAIAGGLIRPDVLPDAVLQALDLDRDVRSTGVEPVADADGSARDQVLLELQVHGPIVLRDAVVTVKSVALVRRPTRGRDRDLAGRRARRNGRGHRGGGVRRERRRDTVELHRGHAGEVRAGDGDARAHSPARRRERRDRRDAGDHREVGRAVRGVVTGGRHVIGPVVAPTGTVAVIWVAEFTVNVVAAVVLNITEFVHPKFVPVMTTLAPTHRSSGRTT